MLIVFIYDICLCLIPQSRLNIFNFNVINLPFSFKLGLWICGCGIITGLIMFIVQKIILMPIFKYLKIKFKYVKWI